MIVPGSANALLLDASTGGYTISRSLRFRRSASAYLNKTLTTPTNNKIWTYSAWVKRGQLGVDQSLLGTTDNNTASANVGSIRLTSANVLEYYEYSSAYVIDLVTTQVFRDCSAWYHIVVSVDTTQATASNRIKFYVNGSQITAFSTATYPSQNYNTYINSAIATYQACYNNAGTGVQALFDGYLAEVNFIDGQALTPSSFGETDATTGVWKPKAYTGGSYGTNGFYLKFADNSAATAAAIGKDSSGNGNNWTPNNLVATSAPYTGTHRYWKAVVETYPTSHFPRSARFVLSNSGGDTTIHTFTSDNCSDVGTIPIPGDSYSYDFGTATSITGFKFYSSYNGGTRVGRIGIYYSNNNSTWTQAFTAICNNNSSCGLISGVNENTPAGVDSLVDVPTNGSEVDTGVGGEVRGNYATLNPLNYTGTVTLSNGNLDATGSNANASSTIAPSSGKWYAEFSFSAIGAAVGFVGISNKLSADAFSGATQTWQLNYTNTGKLENAGSQSNVSTFTTGDIIGVAFDCSNGQATFYKNGSSVGTITGSAFVGVPVLVGVGAGGAAGTNTFTANYGARSFAYTAPSGFKALCTANLPAPTIEKPSTVMDVKVYPGNGSTQTISGFGFSPDLVWLKNRSAGDYHRLNDIIRGANRHLFSNTTDAEVVNDANGYLSAFTSDGFSLTSGTGVNASGNSYAAWCWDAGSSTVTNTQGSISGTVSVRANTTAGFSVVTYTGTGANATVGHGLGVAPKMVIIKRRDTTGNWAVYHAELANTQYMLLNSNAAVATGTTYWNSTSPTSTVFSVGTSADTNASGGTYVAYCFSAVSGYSAFGGYQAGTEPFVFLGFRPRYVMIKRTASGDGWAIFDTSRTTYNVATSRLEADTSAAEGGTDGVDLLSNGFKIKTTWGGMGGSSGSGLMVYAAFAESPFQYARAR